MKTKWFTRLSSLALVGVLALGLTACETINETETAQLSEEEEAVLTSVVADGLALETDGLMAGVYDATADVTPEGLAYRYGYNHENHMGRGPWHGDHDFVAVYDPATGEHTIAFERTIDTPRMEKSMSTELVYIFQDAEGGFLEFPRLDADAVASVAFEGERSGSMAVERTRGQQQGLHTSDFVHTANWVLSGVDADVMTLEGSQARSGSSTIETRRLGTLERTFSMSMNLIDVTIASPTSDEQSLENVVSGTIEFAVAVTITKDGETTTREYEGTIELTSDGYALMRVLGLRHLFRIDLYDGDVVEQ